MTETMDHIEHDVRGFIRENFIVEADELDASDSLTLNGVIDSMGVLELVTFIEQRFGIAVPDRDTVPENLDSIDRIVRYLEGRLAAGDD